MKYLNSTHELNGVNATPERSIAIERVTPAVIESEKSFEGESIVVEEISESDIVISAEDTRKEVENVKVEVIEASIGGETVTSIADEISSDFDGVFENEETADETIQHQERLRIARETEALALAKDSPVQPADKPADAPDTATALQRLKKKIESSTELVRKAALKSMQDLIAAPAQFALNNSPDSFVQACFSGQLKVIEQMLDAGFDANQMGSVTAEDGKVHKDVTPLRASMLATASEEVMPKMLKKQMARIVKLLLSRGALATDIERDLLTHCANHNLSEVLVVLGEHQLRLRRYGYDLMGIALHHGHVEVIQVLSNYGCSVNILNDRGNRPFLDLCSRTLRSPITHKRKEVDSVDGLTERISLFMEVGLNLESTDKVGATALLRAVATGNEAMAWALLANGANPRITLRNGVSATHLAAACMGPAFLRKFLPQTGTYSELVRLCASRLQPDVKAMIEVAKSADGN